MSAAPEIDREYWRGQLTAGGFSPIPRWSLDPVVGVDVHETAVPEHVAAELSRLADDMGVRLSSVLLAAHAAALAALTGELEVVTGYRATAGRLLPCRMIINRGSWRQLVLAARRTESDVLGHQDFPVHEVLRELGRTEPPFETVFDPDDHGGDLDDGTALRVEIAHGSGVLAVRVRYRTEAFDADCAARIAGYHTAALALMAAAPDAEHARQNLLSPAERRFQIEGLAGPRRELPDHRFHELFEQRARACPDAVAAVHGDRQWSYAELNARANRLARALLTRGLDAETVVAVVTERNLDWMASVLAIFKSGGVYLPIEPHFPPDRIAGMLARADCRLVLTEPASTTMLDQALMTLHGIEVVFVDSVDEEGHADDDVGIDVAADQLAYIYFTSGSTGEPKGAMCEHAGFLNHLYAKIDDLEIRDGETVAQIAPQCFDISLWQLVSALLVGGHTLMIDQETILEPERFVDSIVDGRVAVLQVVPSYLEVLLSFLEQNPRDLPDLHCVSVTGEAVTLELVQRWFAANPDVKLANAYGLTETSDDTNHEVMSRAPERGGVPLGPAINNVHVYVVDDRLDLVPLGAPGEIVFSGVCVGRGYVNDAERTRTAYTADPHRPGHRLYRSGDFGRWRPDGKLEFLGRRDSQVKIRGFRIEIGEIENAMLHEPEIRRSAVVIANRGERSAKLVAFYSGAHLDPDDLDERLGRSLPDYMVPSVFHWRDELPLTDNGKIDRKILTAVAEELALAPGIAEAVDEPLTPAERQLAEEWAAILEVPIDQIGRNDDFFDRGGTSLSAVELVIAMDKTVTLRDVTRNPILADLARLVDRERASPPSELLQLLSDPDDDDGGGLVCFPPAGGNAVNFRAMARALRGSGLAIYAAELPGHDLTAEREPFEPIDRVVERVVGEITELDPPRIMLWGHSSGVALALATARRLDREGIDVERVFIGAQLLRDPAERQAEIEALTERSAAEIAAELGADGGYTDLGDLDQARALQVGAAYRHDCISAHQFLVQTLEERSMVKIAAPLTLVVAADDPVTIEWPSRSDDWQLLADSVDVHVLPDGGHYFLRTRPTEAAEAVLRTARPLDFQR